MKYAYFVKRWIKILTDLIGMKSTSRWAAYQDIAAERIPPGASAVRIIKESHAAIHSWPEHRTVTVLIYSCRDFDPQVALRFLHRLFAPMGVSMHQILLDKYDE